MSKRKTSEPVDQHTRPIDWHPRECVESLDEIDYGYEDDGAKRQTQLGPPIVLDSRSGWWLLLIPVFRDVGAGRIAGGVTSRLEWHLDRWRQAHGVLRRKSTIVLRAHQLEALCGAWWSDELAQYQAIADDYQALRAIKGVRRKYQRIPWWCTPDADWIEDQRYSEYEYQGEDV